MYMLLDCKLKEGCQGMVIFEGLTVSPEYLVKYI